MYLRATSKWSRAMSWSSTRSWTSSTVTVWPDSMHSSVTLSEAKRISRSVRRSSSGTSMLALRMAFSILATSNVTSEPLRLMIFMCSLPRCTMPDRRSKRCACRQCVWCVPLGAAPLPRCDAVYYATTSCAHTAREIPDIGFRNDTLRWNIAESLQVRKER